MNCPKCGSDNYKQEKTLFKLTATVSYWGYANHCYGCPYWEYAGPYPNGDEDHE